MQIHDRRYCPSAWRFFLPLLAWLVFPHYAASEVVIKFATLAPEGTPWMQIMHDMSRDVERQSKGDVSFRFYPGGIAGDERDVIRKMRIKQLHGGAFTGFGLGLMLPESRVLELPFLFRDAPEADHVVAAIQPYFEQAFDQKGYVLLSLSEAGPVFIFSNPPPYAPCRMQLVLKCGSGKVIPLCKRCSGLLIFHLSPLLCQMSCPHYNRA